MKTVLLRHARLLTMLGGTIMVSVWTVLRHISNGVNFDVVGQIGLAQQWAQGVHSGAQLGATNYVLKMPLYWLVNNFEFLSPMNRLLILALICNVATFLLLLVLFEKIAALYGVRDRSWLYLALLWLATIAGNVFWADYANSRNLETVGGIVFIYLVLRFIRSQWIGTAALAAVVGSVVFFADSLQLYVCGAGACALVVYRFVRRRRRADALLAAKVFAITALSYLGAKLIQLLVERWLHISFLIAPREPLQLAALPSSIRTMVTSTFDIFGANVFKQPYDLNSIRELLSLSLLVGLLYLLIRARSKLHASLAVSLGLSVIVINYAVYVASGQAALPGTYRYLIMVPLLAVLFVAVSGDYLVTRHTRPLRLGGLGVLALSSLLLFGALVTHWPNRHSNDAHIYATSSFLSANGLDYSLSSREAGVTTTYFTQGKATVLPLLCTADHRLVPTDLFYDDGAFQRFDSYNGPSAIVVPGSGIVSGSLVCDINAVTAQFGPADSQQIIPGVGVALRYTPAALRAQLSAGDLRHE